MTRLDNITGFVHPKYAKIEKIFKVEIQESFRKNFHDGWEREGAAIAVYHKGELIVDLQGGYADKSSGRKWTPETRTVVFSATKAGLAALDEPISREDAKNFEKMAYIIAKQKPNWEPGTKSGYHAVTYGWIVDQIVRRVDPRRRSVGQFFREEVAIKYGIDFHIGLPSSEEHTVSRLSLPSTAHVLKEIIHDPRVLFVLGVIHLRSPTSIARKVKKNTQWLKLDQNLNTFNDPELHTMEQVAALGITKARDLARLFSLMLSGELFSKQLLERFKTPLITSEIDEIVIAPLPKGYGFLYERHPTAGKCWLVGHPGFGGSTVMMDMEDEVVIAYVTNGLKTGMGELTRTYRHLRNAVFECLNRKEVP
ncbi:unnamed protein product [Angiostrongylus costaricensis]|uniref:Beta-lactamase domain-containing protein n=1 Tax=Angiostrongylus costaricensis TaxID=334426 RepID=A0A158PGE4_ANGCS|nr:unnamed protein product [Angiostrongylus costaricensis]